MEIEVIQKAGIPEPQAKIYLALVRNGALTPTKIAEITGETRTNCYALLEKLEKIKLVRKTDTKKASFEATHPSGLEVLAEKRRRIMSKNEQELKANISTLTDIFYAHNEMPGSKTLHGVDGIKDILMDALRTSEDVYLLRTTADRMLGDDSKGSWLRTYRNELPKKGIYTYAITPDTKEARDHISSGRDQEINFCRTLMPKGAYSAPVAIQIYGDKVAFMAFGETEMSTVITSPVISEAMRQMFKVAQDYWAKNYPQPENKQV